MSDDSQEPLGGLKVIDMTSLAMGPLAAQILGDYGAEVIKVEPPAGDPFRQTLPTRSAGMGHVYLQYNRNKRSLVLDLKNERARAAFLKVVETADILISNVRPSGMRRLGLDYESIKEINPRLIYCGAYGYSEKGPYRGRPAADDTIQAMSGIAALAERATGSPNFAPSVIADKAVGLTLANAVMATLLRRHRTGRGEYLEVPMFETMVAFVMPEHLGGESYVPSAGPTGYGRIINAVRRPFATRDGHLCVLPYTTDQWRRFFRLIGRDDLAADETLASPAARNARIEELYLVVAEALPARDTKDWVERLIEADIMFGEVLTPEEVIDDPHLRALGMFPVVEHPSEGQIRLIAPPVQFQRKAASIKSLPPRLGEHSREILLEAGVPAAQVEGLLAEGALVDSGASDPAGLAADGLA